MALYKSVYYYYYYYYLKGAHHAVSCTRSVSFIRLLIQQMETEALCFLFVCPCVCVRVYRHAMAEAFPDPLAVDLL